MSHIILGLENSKLVLDQTRIMMLVCQHQPIGRVVATHTNNQPVVSGLMDPSPAERAMHCHNNDVVVMEPHLQQMTIPTGASTVATAKTEGTDITSKRGGHPQGITTGAINAHNTLMAEALDECVIEISSLKYTTTEKSCILGNGKKLSVPRGSYEKAAVKFCNTYNLERIENSIDMALSRTKVGRKLKVHHRGTESPMIGIETHLLASILRQAPLHQPVSCDEGLS
jgi:hypothetical protein